MAPDRILVFLPCHALDDFPTWLEEPEADALLAAWTAAWHPWLIATVGAAPWWASVDLPPATDGSCLGIVPAPWDDRFAAQANALCIAGSAWVRNVAGAEDILATAARELGHDGSAPLPGADLAEEFRDLGLARLLAELLARRMRSSLDDERPAVDAAVVAAARAAVAGDATSARASLRECYATLEGTRARYYPVDVWLVDLVLLAESTLGRGLDRELLAPVPLGLVATGRVVEALAAANPGAVERIRARIDAGTLTPAGGRYDARPLDACAPEQILDSLDRGMAAWRGHAGRPPRVYAACGGGSSAILPQVLAGLGFKGAVWTLFDGTPLPDPGAGRIRWEGSGGGVIDGIGRSPLDARLAKTILALPGRIGDAMDHDHTVVIPFAHYAGTAGHWFEALRRIGAASSLLGTFVTPDDFFSRTAGAGTTVSFEPDAYPVTLPAAGGAADGRPAGAADQAAAGDAVTTFVAATADEARGLLAACEPLREALPPRRGPESPPRGAPARPGAGGWGLGHLFAAGTPRRDELVLEHEWLRVQVHAQTGGLLSVRRPADRANRLSQRLAVRSTRPPPPPGRPWEDPLERAEYADMRADAVARVATPSGAAAVESRGRLVGAGSRDVGRFTQRVELVPGLPLAVLTLDVRLATRPHGPLLEHHAACRFAWNENEDLEIRRSLHTQSTATERGRFTAPWFVELGDPWDDSTKGAPGVAILTGGLPWHLRSSPHMLDTVLPTSSAEGGCRMAVGVDLDRPWDVAIALCAGVPTSDLPTAGCLAGVPRNVRLTVGGVRFEAGRLAGARVGLLESAGRAGEAEVAWAADVLSARVADWTGTEPADTASDARVRVDGRTTSVYLRRHEWLPLDVEFRP